MSTLECSNTKMKKSCMYTRHKSSVPLSVRPSFRPSISRLVGRFVGPSVPFFSMSKINVAYGICLEEINYVIQRFYCQFSYITLVLHQAGIEIQMWRKRGMTRFGDRMAESESSLVWSFIAQRHSNYLMGLVCFLLCILLFLLVFEERH